MENETITKTTDEIRLQNTSEIPTEAFILPRKYGTGKRCLDKNAKFFMDYDYLHTLDHFFANSKQKRNVIALDKTVNGLEKELETNFIQNYLSGDAVNWGIYGKPSHIKEKIPSLELYKILPDNTVEKFGFYGIEFAIKSVLAKNFQDFEAASYIESDANSFSYETKGSRSANYAGEITLRIMTENAFLDYKNNL